MGGDSGVDDTGEWLKRENMSEIEKFQLLPINLGEQRFSSGYLMFRSKSIIIGRKNYDGRMDIIRQGKYMAANKR